MTWASSERHIKYISKVPSADSKTFFCLSRTEEFASLRISKSIRNSDNWAGFLKKLHFILSMPFAEFRHKPINIFHVCYTFLFLFYLFLGSSYLLFKINNTLLCYQPLQYILNPNQEMRRISGTRRWRTATYRWWVTSSPGSPTLSPCSRAPLSRTSSTTREFIFLSSLIAHEFSDLVYEHDFCFFVSSNSCNRFLNLSS